MSHPGPIQWFPFLADLIWPYGNFKALVFMVYTKTIINGVIP